MYFTLWFFLICMVVIAIYNAHRLNLMSTKFVFLFLLFFEAILLSMRPMGIPDVKAYQDIFEMVSVGKAYSLNLLTRDYSTGVEFGFLYLIELFKFFFGSKFRLFLVFLTIISTIMLVENSISLVEIIQKENHPEKMELTKKEKYELRIITLCIFFCYFSMNYQGIAIRQALSFSLCLYAFNMLINKNFMRTIISVIVAFSFHRMTVIFIVVLLVFLFCPIIKSKKTYGVILFVSFYLLILGQNTNIIPYMMGLIRGLYEFVFKYVNYSSYLGEFVHTMSIDKKRLVVIFLILLLGYYLKKDSNLSNRLLNVYFFGIIVLVLTSNIDGSARIYDYLTIFYIPLLASCWIENKRNVILKTYIVIFIIIEFIVSFRIWGVM